MFDKYGGTHIINFGDFAFTSKRFEVWSQGQQIHGGDMFTTINFATTVQKLPSINGINVRLSTLLPETIIARSFSFDICHTGNDRMFVSIIAANTNCENYNSYIVYRANAPLLTRQNKMFEYNEPYVCSIFTINNVPSKITFGLSIAQTLVEFYQT